MSEDLVAACVVGVDYGTRSGRAVVVRVSDGAELGSAVYEPGYQAGFGVGYEPARPDGSWDGYLLDVLRVAVPRALKASGVFPGTVVGIGFTARTTVPASLTDTPADTLTDSLADTLTGTPAETAPATLSQEAAELAGLPAGIAVAVDDGSSAAARAVQAAQAALAAAARAASWAAEATGRAGRSAHDEPYAGYRNRTTTSAVAARR